MSWLDLLPDLTEEQRAEVRDEPPEAVIARGWADRREVLARLSQHYGLPALDLVRYHPDEQCLSLLSEEQARQLHVFPLFQQEGKLYVAADAPSNLRTLDFVRKLTSLDVVPVVALHEDIEAALNRFFLSASQATRAIEAIPVPERAAAGDKVVLEDREAPVIKLTQRILTQAVRLGASDIHLEPFPGRALLRYRVDGRLHEYPAPPLSLYPAIISRVKILARMDIAERRLPQDGRASLEVDGRSYDLRVSIIPNLHGEGLVIRVLNPHSIQLELSALGFEPDMLEEYARMIRHPWGMVLVTGPTGSGKSTTLYATIKHIANPSRKFVTLEDPVEYQLEGITQIQVNADIGYTYAHGLRAVLRHDPDVILVGEIRDLESAQIAVRAAMTGHLLFSTLHTNDAPSALTRLEDMGLAPYQARTALVGVLAQRLLRRLCPRCKVELPFDPRLGLDTPAFGPKGCPECHELGYRGRVAVYELLTITPEIREGHPARPSLTLYESAIRKVAQGLTSPEEALALEVG